MAATLRVTALRRPRFWGTVLRGVALATGIIGVWIFVVQPLTGSFSGRFEDFGAYLGAAQTASSHADIYPASAQLQPDVAFSRLGFIYPPVAALLVTPLAWFPAHAAATLWLLLGVAATFGACVIVATSVLPQRWPRLELAVLATFLFGASTYNFWHGQINPFIFLLLALALRSWMRGNQTACGVLVGLAAAIKVAPIVLVLLMLRRRWWLGCAMALGTFALLTAIGILAFGAHTTLVYFGTVLPMLSSDDGWLYIQSWDGVLNRLADHSVLAFQPDVVVLRLGVLAASAATVLGAAWSVRASESSHEQRAGQFAAGVVAMLLAGSITWYAHDVHLLIAFAAAAALVARRAAGHEMLRNALVATVVCTAIVVPLLIGVASMNEIVSISRTGWWYPLLVLTSIPALATGWLLIALVRSSRPTQVVRTP